MPFLHNGRGLTCTLTYGFDLSSSIMVEGPPYALIQILPFLHNNGRGGLRCTYIKFCLSCIIMIKDLDAFT